ncbi:mechanosensitive ion channel domain-containing protein [Hirsutella rhossiliensis]|uniref:Mechanosensitive ion channel protein n=1 Tax=Hirsutella rhossiliensis TaxID=111463 RepID=A0A9P8SNN2_9HYPO|nr:mechanosensitive ion channel domain-containing protein [Hirsutella rhossiliensis]KAH0968060.1 mechanosensitive ion channel domain-containing protein [Hirsutella rhossiliensis]
MAGLADDEPAASSQQPHHRPQQQPLSPHQQPPSPHQQDEFDEKHSAPSLETFNTQATANDPHCNDNHSGLRAEATRLNDDLELLRAERFVSNQEQELASKYKNRIHNPEPEDAFNQPASKDVTAKPKNEDAALYRFWLFLKKFPRFVRYIVYLIPGAALLLIPVLLGAFRFRPDEKLVGGNGGVELLWFGIWLEIVWCSLWLSRLVTSLMPHLFYSLARVGGSINAKKWKDIGQQLELHTALFLWFLAILISFMPTNDGHRGPVDDTKDVNMGWIDIVNKVIIALFTLASLNFVEKIVIQWIATSFHQRTYSTRIVNNKADVRQLVQLYEFAKAKLEHSDSFWQRTNAPGASGAQTPLQSFHENARQVLGKVGQVANKVGNDLIGRKVDTNVPRQVVSELLRSTLAAHTLARLIYRSVVRDDRDTVYPDDLKHVFETQDEVDAAFSVFDKDLNGDISIEEFETVCNEIHLEKKAIAASLKDLDSVIEKLDKVFLVIIVVIAVIVFISILSGSAAAGLASAGTSFLGLAWMLQATAQEFLQSVIFVFIKHPFDVGDRVTIYGSTGADMTGDDYYVTEISLLYTEFKKMQGHIVQAPNSLLNTLFILNQRRSNGLADVLPLEMRFGTPACLIDELKDRMLDYCLNNKRDFQPTIITEMTKLDQVRSCHMNMVFMHKSNFQNELLRLNRHNKFVTELMHQMTQLGIQGPLRVDPGGSREEQPQDDHGPAPHAVPNAVPPNMRMRSGSVRSQRLPTTNEEAILGFQDVIENRRDHTLTHRMASIREKERGLKSEAEADVQATASGITRMSQSDVLGMLPPFYDLTIVFTFDFGEMTQ